MLPHETLEGDFCRIIPPLEAGRRELIGAHGPSVEEFDIIPSGRLLFLGRDLAEGLMERTVQHEPDGSILRTVVGKEKESSRRKLGSSRLG